MDTIGISINQDLITITNEIDNVLKTKLNWEKSDSYGDDVVSISSTVSKDQIDILEDAKMDKFCSQFGTLYDYNIDMWWTDRQDFKYDLIISVSLETYIIVDIVSKTFS